MAGYCKSYKHEFLAQAGIAIKKEIFARKSLAVAKQKC